MTDQELNDWLNSYPEEHEVVTEVKPDGRKYRFIPYEVTKANLDIFAPGWGTENFNHFFYQYNGELYISGSIDVIVRGRKLAGAATFTPKDYPRNSHWGATCKTLCLANAVQVLGKRFGWGLNDDLKEENEQIIPHPKKTKRSPAKMKPDRVITAKYLQALTNKDFKTADELSAIYNFNIEEYVE